MRLTDLSTQTAIVTGAAQGIGAAVTEALARRYVQVAAWDNNAAALMQKAESWQAEGLAVSPFLVDVSNCEQVEDSVDEVEQSLGAVDILVNVAGILRLAPVTELSNDDWLQTFAVNTHGVFFLSRAVARAMQQRQRGNIITIGSNAAMIPRTQMAAYAASKAATVHLNKCLALELAAYGIRCNTISPGSTDTPMQRQYWQDDQAEQAVLMGSLASYRTGIPLQRITQPEDVADAVLFLVSDQARQITMQDLCIDGGATLGV